MSIVTELLRQRETAALVEDWQMATEAMTIEEKARFLAVSLDLAADSRDTAKRMRRAGAQANFQMRLMALAREGL